MIEATAETLGIAYPELVENRAYILQVAASEEERFAGTLRQGMALFEAEVEGKKRGRTLAGDVAFKLHDTHGFPLELTEELAADAGLEVDTERFALLMEEQRARASAAAKRGPLAGEALSGAVSGAGPTEFLGYETLASEARVLAVLAGDAGVETAGEGSEVRIILDRTPFYAESGGQVGDGGLIRTPGSLVRVLDTQRAPGDAFVHVGRVSSGEIRVGDEAHAEVDRATRDATARAHSATHVVHWTLRQVLGEHARQAGSLVAPGRLRFDFTHHSAVPQETLEEIEYTANERLAENAPVRAYETTMEFAKGEGAIALFGEKYGDLVRVVEIGDYSRELCGGTHVGRTGNICVVKLLGEGSIGSGMRRIEALVGPDAIKHINAERRLLDEIVAALGGGDPDTAPERARRAIERIKRLESELGKIRKGDVAELSGEVAGRAEVVSGVSLVASLEDGEADALRELAQAVLGRLSSAEGAAVVLGSRSGSKALLVAACSPNLVAKGVTAPKLLEGAAGMIGGGAGGKPGLGFAGGPKAEAVEGAVRSIPGRLGELLGGA